MGKRSNRLSNLRVGDSIWCAKIEFRWNKIASCAKSIPLVEIKIEEFICKDGTVKRKLELKNKFCYFLEDLSDSDLDYYGIYSTREEAVEAYNSSILNEIDHVNSVCQDKLKYLEKKLLK